MGDFRGDLSPASKERDRSEAGLAEGELSYAFRSCCWMVWRRASGGSSVMCAWRIPTVLVYISVKQRADATTSCRRRASDAASHFPPLLGLLGEEGLPSHVPPWLGLRDVPGELP